MDQNFAKLPRNQQAKPLALCKRKMVFERNYVLIKQKLFFVYMTRDLELIDITQSLYVFPYYHQSRMVRKLDKYSVPTNFILVLLGEEGGGGSRCSLSISIPLHPNEKEAFAVYLCRPDSSL